MTYSGDQRAAGIDSGARRADRPRHVWALLGTIVGAVIEGCVFP